MCHHALPTKQVLDLFSMTALQIIEEGDETLLTLLYYSCNML